MAKQNYYITSERTLKCSFGASALVGANVQHLHLNVMSNMIFQMDNQMHLKCICNLFLE